MVFRTITNNNTTSIFLGESKNLGLPNDENGHLEIHGSCSVVYENNLIIFGGKTDKNQVLMVKSMRAQNHSKGHYAFMERLNRLSFNLEEGACNTFLDSSGDELILLCFDKERPRECHFFNDLNKKSKNVPSRNSIELDRIKSRRSLYYCHI